MQHTDAACMYTDIDLVLSFVYIDCLYVIRTQPVFGSIMGECIGFGVIEVDTATVCSNP